MNYLLFKDRFLKFLKSDQSLHLGLLSLLWIVSFLLIKPTGNFPLADDWAYAKTVKIFVESHKIQILEWYAMSFMTQLFWGALFCIVFGFSFFILRVSTIVIGIIGVIYFYYLIKKIANSQLAFISCLVFAFNPLYFNLSYSFMTDVPFLSLLIISLYYYIESIRTEKLQYLAIATVFALLATLLRQMGIILPFAVIVAFLFRKAFSLKWLFYSTGSFLLSIFSLFCLQRYLAATGNLSSRFGGLDVILSFFKNKNVSEIIFSREASLIEVTGFLISPLFFLMIPKSKISIKTVYITLLILLPVILYWDGLFPGNYINNFNIGPLTFKDSFGSFSIVDQMIKNRPFELIKMAGFFGGFILVLRIVLSLNDSFSKKYSPFETQVKMMAIAFIAAYLVFYICSPIVFDRYSLPLLLFVPILFVPFGKSQMSLSVKIASYGSIAVMFIFSIISTHDYYNINKGRWDGVHYLFKTKKATIHDIDGGFEVNAWYNYDFNLKKSRSSPGKTWWWVDDDKYLIALSHLPNYDVDTIFTFQNWIRNSIHNVYILKRSSTIDTIKPQVAIDFETLTNDSTGFVASNQIIKIKSIKNISTKAHSGKHSLCITPSTADSIYVNLNSINADDYCEMQFWTNTSKLDAKIRIKIFCTYWEGGYQPVKTENGWTLYKVGFYASSGLSGYTNNVDIKIVPKDKKDVLIDDMKLFVIKK